MRLACRPFRQPSRRIVVSLAVAVFWIWSFVASRRHASHHLSSAELEQKFPLLYRHVHSFNGTGGAWHIPAHWLRQESSDFHPENIVDAALLAFQATHGNPARMMGQSAIPLIVHQTWKNRRADTWTDLLRSCVERWLTYVVADDNVAYFFWEDDGITGLLDEFEPDFVDSFLDLPANVERSDVFRILVLKWFGGIYTDVDTQPFRHPASWITPNDLTPWTDTVAGTTFESTKPISLMLGIEADCDPDKDDYWRMGYSYPVQLTQWTLASAPAHPVLLRFMDTLTQLIASVATHNGGSTHSSSAQEELALVGPLALTGPAAITAAAQSWLHEQAGLRWNALSSLDVDGSGRAKAVDDVLILPITGFSPGRDRYRNMGSRPVTDPAARVWHRAQGSWRSFRPKIEFGKACRTLLGRCRYWPKD